VRRWRLFDIVAMVGLTCLGVSGFALGAALVWSAYVECGVWAALIVATMFVGAGCGFLLMAFDA